MWCSDFFFFLEDSAAHDTQISAKKHFFQNSVPIILSSSEKSIYGTSQSCCQRAQPLPKPSRNNKECSMCFLKSQVKFVCERSNPGTSPGSLHTERLVLFLLYNFTALSSFRFSHSCFKRLKFSVVQPQISQPSCQCPSSSELQFI